MLDREQAWNLLCEFTKSEGLRKHALDSFVAPGPTAKTFRVLIGPFADADGYQKARNIVAEIGLDNFARRYQAQ